MSSLLGTAGQVLRLALPSMGTYLLLISTETINLVSLGRASGTTPHTIAGLGLGNMVYNCMALAIGFGFTSSQDTLVTQAVGRRDYELCRLYLHRCQVWMVALAAASTVVIILTEPLLLLLRATDVETARQAGIYTRFYVGGLLPTFQYSTLRKFVMAHQDAMAGLLVQMVSIPLHVLWCMVLVSKFSVQGLGMAMLLKGWTDFALLALYVSCLRPSPHYWGWWRFWRALQGERTRVWGGMRDYLRLAIPGVVMFVSEWWAFEMLGFFAAYMHKPVKLAAHVTAANISSIFYLSGTGTQKAASTLVGAAVGRRAEGDVRAVTLVALGWNCLCGMLLGISALAFRYSLTEVYTPGKAEVQEVLVSLVPLLAVLGLADGTNQCLQGLLYGLGLQHRSGRVSILCYWVLLPPTALLLCFALGLGLQGLWCGQILASATAVSLNARIYSKSDFQTVTDVASSRMALDSPAQSFACRESGENLG